MSQLTFTSLQQLLQSQTQRSFTDLSQTHPFSFSQSQQIPPTNLHLASQQIETPRLENARNYFQIRRNDVRHPSNPFSSRDENLMNDSNGGRRKLARIIGVKKVLMSQRRIRVDRSEDTVISQAHITTQSHLSRSPARLSDNKSQRSNGSPRASEIKEKNLKSPFSKNSSAVKNLKPEVSTATRQYRLTNKVSERIDERTNINGKRLFRPQVELVVRPTNDIISEQADPELEDSDYDKPLHLIARKVKGAKEDIPIFIEFKNNRRCFAFKLFPTEKTYVRFLAKCQDRLRSVQGDNDVETDEDEKDAAIEKCFNNFCTGLQQSVEEEKIRHKLNGPRNKSVSPMLVGIQQIKRTPSFMPAQQHPNYRADVQLPSPLRDPMGQRNRSQSIFKANAYRG